ncbi:hypothetical protein HA49_23165 [Tatumella morbirosei]|uniref:Uncharacterized protein n=1 Tax=Tatumella morbirosei TaxID=642227 RepID=A0A0F5BUR7_9GAMM|nr:hypothetical protein HA49_23165 [Tatumella morbirosei]
MLAWLPLLWTQLIIKGRILPLAYEDNLLILFQRTFLPSAVFTPMIYQSVILHFGLSPRARARTGV